MSDPHSSIKLSYPIRPAPRYGHGAPPHLLLYEIIDGNRAAYRKLLTNLLDLTDEFFRIPLEASTNATQPCWKNTWLPGLDAAVLYGLLSARRPKCYVEIGSGQSTKFARRAIIDHSLSTQITSIDPHPRAEIDGLCDRVIRKPLEDADLTLFGELEPGDFVFLDGSHFCFMNSDATVFFLDILPRLQPGTLVQIHDVTLPYDYPPEWIERYYSEQYLLAVYLLTKRSFNKIVLPSVFVTEDPELSRILSPIWSDPRMAGVETHGGSFWFEV